MSRHVSNGLKARAKKLAAQEQIPYSAALARLRTTRDASRTQPSHRPSTWAVPEYLFIDLPAPELGDARPCEDCRGRGLTGDTFALGVNDDSGTPPLLVEVVCPSCLGCGRAEHDEERGCGHLHAEGDEDLLDERAEEDDQDEEPCYSCHGWRFYYLPGVTKDDNGAPQQVVYLRHPCGCTESSARIIIGEPEKVIG
ncbi:hypothetical protein [Streptomyces sp. CL12-4]|uniref:hypothetical protein n=1 Tax=Streptomyces sp. CL12-4 TaxID=2810306 RepID=UPI001EFB22D3|nr:hypothetical protein [Streptomyces sp. CL12-4]MCG8971798.1 hypothetical protein [Streptomyces sp. CL12-4]